MTSERKVCSECRKGYDELRQGECTSCNGWGELSVVSKEEDGSLTIYHVNKLYDGLKYSVVLIEQFQHSQPDRV